jgi:hypothetical protein
LVAAPEDLANLPGEIVVDFVVDEAALVRRNEGSFCALGVQLAYGCLAFS